LGDYIVSIFSQPNKNKRAHKPAQAKTLTMKFNVDIEKGTDIVFFNWRRFLAPNAATGSAPPKNEFNR